jgi:choline dehydrogenase-like flavoprotein
MSLSTAVVSPTSRGYITINSTDPLDLPVMDTALLKDEFDQAVMVEALKRAFEFLAAPSFNGYIVAPINGLQNSMTDEELRQYAMNSAGTINHPIGSAAMSPKDATYGVVDPDLVLKKVSGVRIVDASIFVSVDIFIRFIFLFD